MNKSFWIVLVALSLVTIGWATAADDEPHKIVIQVSSDDPKIQTMAINNAVNLQKHYGMDNIDIEIVAYGPGLGMLTEEYEQASRIRSLLIQDVIFHACGNTLDTIERKSGDRPVLIEGVEVVQAGAARILELQEQGYGYLRP